MEQPQATVPGTVPVEYVHNGGKGKDKDKEDQKDDRKARRKLPSRAGHETKFDVGPRYQLVKSVGAGAYGLVWSAIDAQDPPAPSHAAKGNVAIKKVTNPFAHKIDAKRLMREVLLLSSLKHRNILGFRDLITSEENGIMAMYIITDLMDIDLHKVISSRQTLTERHIQCFMAQILMGLHYIHSAGILHRDIKPSNVLLNEDCELRICDFGLARPIPRKAAEEHKVDNDNSKFMTEYVVTRWYRSPELLLQETYYTTAIDVWSCGCILAELLGRRPIFPGNDYIEQLLCITTLCGTPSAQDISNIGSKQAQNFIKTLEERQPVSFGTVYPNASPEAIDLLSKMLKFNYHDRITVSDALSHPFLRHLSQMGKPVASRRFLFEYDGMNLSLSQMKEIVLREVCKYHPETQSQLDEVHDKNIQNSEPLPQPLPAKEGEDAPVLQTDIVEAEKEKEQEKPAEDKPDVE